MTSLLPGASRMAIESGLTLASGAGAHLRDADGKEYLDLYTGVGAGVLGHAHPRWLHAMQEQLSRLVIGTFNTTATDSLLESLHPALPPSHDVQFYSTGSEAVEAALRIARSVTGKPLVLSFQSGFHGKTAGALSLHSGERRSRLLGLPTSVEHIPYAETACSGFSAEGPRKSTCACLEPVVKRLQRGDIAAVFVEPVQGTAGNVVPHAGWFRSLAGLTAANQVLFVADEVITGFGKAGRFFASQREGVVPDLLVMGKGMGNGYPVSAVSAPPELLLDTPAAEASSGSSTFGGNPMALTAANATIQVLNEEGLLDRALELETISETLRQHFQSISAVHRYDVYGSMLGVSLREGDGTPWAQDKSKEVFRRLVTCGVIAMAYSAEIRLYPPLTIGVDRWRQGLLALAECIVATEKGN